ncbi:uncharacterized protein LOC118460228 [Anopheles albimanus]|uniref:uncharacterized protein LOC118460228 n=1 Tax=Anopheles albimanus TaxID=7167 RepID=UPI00163F7A34|nr:uncharacterized protein LOC118460228 [Anopheles albimanus]
MVVNSVRGSVVSYLGSLGAGPDAARALDRSHLTAGRWNPAIYGGPSGPSVPLGPGYTALDGGGGAGGGGAFYHHPVHHPLMGAADGSHGYGMRFSSGEGYGSSGGGSGSSSSSSSSGHGGYDYHPPPPAIHAPPILQSHPPVHLLAAYSGGGHSSIGKSHRGKGAALSALTLLAFLYFLNMLQGCLKEHMATMNPTVMVMTAGATRRKDTVAGTTEQDRSSDESDDEQEGQENAEDYDDGGGGGGGAAAAIERYEAISRRYQLLTSSNQTLNPYVKPSTRPTLRTRIPETPSRNQQHQQHQQQHQQQERDQWRPPATTTRSRPANRYGPDHAGSDWRTSERGRH